MSIFSVNACPLEGWYPWSWGETEGGGWRSAKVKGPSLKSGSWWDYFV